MNNKLAKAKLSDNRNLSSDEYFKKLIEELVDNNILTEKELENILYRRIELLKEKLTYYTRNESSSISEEEAENILEGIDYTLGLYFKSLNIEKSVDVLRKSELSNSLKEGEKIIKAKFEKNKVLFKKLKENRLMVNNYSYDDTMEYGLSVFFSKYEMFFKPHEGEGSIDYQIPVDILMYKGIEYIEKYLCILIYESELCNKFKSDELIGLLKNYDSHYEELLINVFQIVLFNILGRVLCGKTLKGLSLNNNDILQIQNDLSNLSKDEVTLRLIKAFKEGMAKLKIDNKELIDYGALLIGKEINCVYMNISENTLQNIFVIYKKKEERKKIRYTDGNKLKDSKFREYTKMIRDNKSMNEKLEIIINNFKSLNDIVDMLESECLFGEEYEVFFRSIPEIYKVLLLKYMDIQYSEGEYDEEWCIALKKNICNLNKEELAYYKNKVDEIDYEI